MKTLGLIGGISSFSTEVYYRTINNLVNMRLGGSHSAKLILHSIDFEEYKVLQEKGDWKQIETMLTSIAIRLSNAGADCIIICSNTPHMIADGLAQNIQIPLIHIADETALEIERSGIKKVGLIGTAFTMENNFFIDRIKAKGIEVIIPEADDRKSIHASIITSLTKGIYSDSLRDMYFEIIGKLAAKGARGIIFGCTEIGLLIDPDDCGVPVFDTTVIHSKAAVDFALT